MDNTAAITITESRRKFPIVPMLAILIFPLLQYGLAPRLDALLTIPLAIVLYGLSVYLFMAVADLTYRGRTYLFWGGAVLGYVVGFSFTGLNSVWQIITEWSMLMFGGAVIGRLTERGKPPLKVYLIGAFLVTLFALGTHLPNMELYHEYFEKMRADFVGVAHSLGGSASETSDQIALSETLFNFSQRTLPAILSLNAVMQFSIGYILFAILLTMRKPARLILKPFHFWKMPFGATFVLVGAILFRLIGTELLIQIADNILLVLFVYYSVTGLALIQYYLLLFRMSIFMKSLFYIMLFLTQVIGFLAAVLIGFIDSFADFRKKQLLSFEKE